MGATLTSILDILSKGAIAGGVGMIVWGGIRLGTGVANQNSNGAQLSEGFWWIVGGAIVGAAGVLFTTIDLSWAA